MNFAVVVHQLGRLLLMLTAFLLGCAVFSFTEIQVESERMAQLERPALLAFLTAACVSGVLGLVAIFSTRNKPRDIGRREACLLVVSSWVLGALIAGIPFACWSAYCDQPEARLFAGFANPFFEAMSGITTCGATILGDIEILPRSILLWRSFLQWIGGLGIVVLFVAILPSLGVGGKKMFLTESTGPSPEGLRPHARETARVLWGFYLGLTVTVCLLLILLDMHWFDAVCHAFTCIATGGFSTRNASIGAFDSVSIDIVLMIFMLASGVSFSLYYSALRRRFDPIRRSPELRMYLMLTLLVAVVCSVSLISWGGEILLTNGEEVSSGIGNSIRYATFTTISIITTTGYTTAAYEAWPGLALVALMMIYMIGGMAGSTSGGMKVIRVWIAGKLMLSEVEKEFRPSVVRPLKVGRVSIPTDVRTSAIVLVLFTLSIVGFGCGMLEIFEGSANIDLTTSLSASASCVANVGPGLGRVGADDNFGFLTSGSKITLSILMLLGRLELFVVLALFTRRFWARG